MGYTDSSCPHPIPLVTNTFAQKSHRQRQTAKEKDRDREMGHRDTQRGAQRDIWFAFPTAANECAFPFLGAPLLALASLSTLWQMGFDSEANWPWNKFQDLSSYTPDAGFGMQTAHSADSGRQEGVVLCWQPAEPG